MDDDKNLPEDDFELKATAHPKKIDRWLIILSVWLFVGLVIGAIALAFMIWK